MPAGEALAGETAAVPLVDHHVHGAFRRELTQAEFEDSINEGSPDPVPGWMSQFDSQLGFAIRRWCAPLLGLPAHVPAADYWARRTELGTQEVTERLLRAAGVSDWLLDTGYGADEILSPAEMSAASGSAAHTIVRLEAIAEEIAAEGKPGRDYPDEFHSRLAEATRNAVAVKTIIAYRSGFGIDLSRPDKARVQDAASRWIDAAGPGRPRLVDPVLLSFGLHAATQAGLPIQVHTGYGDRDLDLDKANPLLLLDFLRDPRVAQVPVLLLHCYPYQREGGYLAQAFTNVYFDVGLGVNYVGAASPTLVAESLELAPFAKQMYSSDAWGPPELHFLGAALWRRAITSVTGRWVDSGDWSAVDARRVISMLARDNALRVYQLG
jgi:predicted TIM-barrel fold metal-dependent hydrolase